MTTNTFPLTGSINLHARLGHGSLTVHAVEGLTEATVALTRRGASLQKGDDALERISVELRGPTLFITAPRQGGIFDMIGGWRRERDAVDVEVRVPTGTAVKASTFTADVTIDGRCGGADIATGAASITLDYVDGDLLLRYGSGSSTVRRVDGSVTIRSGSGDAKLGEVTGAVHAGCGSGRLEVGSVRGAVRSRAGTGDALLSAVYGDVDLASGSGTVQIGLPAGLAARLDVTTGSGSVNTDLPIEGGPRHDGPTITVRARTGSGNIRLFRAA
ncbi:DUF4097 family beta strand repeat-containing protein [Jatrophihabitans sp.]|uniref:DUF4097 family beta strand repeat-containing protein n=1 Tax=Jatrophihabitans sp. TaxID=1932789 RepID=UPI0030C67F4A|nr:hypothetical protein [Jatrophihabitans sp.]